MKFSAARKIRITITIVILLLAVYANLFVIRRMAGFAEELFLYDKLLVAYRLGGGVAGLKTELNDILSHDKAKHELAVAREFEKNLSNISAPEEFLQQAVKEKKARINLLRNLRIAAFALILAILLLRLALNLLSRRFS